MGTTIMVIAIILISLSSISLSAKNIKSMNLTKSKMTLDKLKKKVLGMKLEEAKQLVSEYGYEPLPKKKSNTTPYILKEDQIQLIYNGNTKIVSNVSTSPDIKSIEEINAETTPKQTIS